MEDAPDFPPPPFFKRALLSTRKTLSLGKNAWRPTASIFVYSFHLWSGSNWLSAFTPRTDTCVPLELSPQAQRNVSHIDGGHGKFNFPLAM